MGSLLFIIQGFLAKIITGADDTLTHTPLINLLAKTKKGKFMFVLGMFTSIFILVLGSIFFASLLQSIPYKNILSSLLLLALATLVYHNHFIDAGRKKYFLWAKKKISRELRLKVLFGMGILVFFATGIDDFIVYSALFTTEMPKKLLIATGIIMATIVELTVIFYFSKVLSKIKHIEKITLVGLVILAVLVGFEIL